MQNNQNQPKEIYIDLVSMYSIKDRTKIIKFKNSSTNEIYTARISQYFTKSELYWLIKQYIGSNFILIYKDDLLENDESNIDEITNGDTIEIFKIYNQTRDKSHKNNIYYHYLLEKNKNCTIKNVICSFITGIKFVFHFPSDISISQLIKAIKFEINCKDDVVISSCGEKLNDNDNTKLS